MRASVAVEAAGIPTVSLVCEGFERQASATARGLGYDGLALGVLVGHVDAQESDEMISSLVDNTLKQVIEGLTSEFEPAEGTVAEPSALEIVASGDIGYINEIFINKDWSDGSPIMPPTIDRVESFIGESGHDPWKSIGVAKPSGREMTVWSIAVNAVMAGCTPAHLPILIALAEIIANEQYGVEHSGNTTGADALIILNGKSAAELGFNHGQGALRDGVHANTSVGRWLRLYLRNVCGFTAGEHDKATFGNSFKVVLYEDQAALDELGWTNVAEGFGFKSGADFVTMARMNSGSIVGSVFGATPEEILPYLADGLARTSGWDLTHVYGLGQGHFEPLLVLSPLLARTFAKAGWSKDDVREALFEQARIPASKFEKLIGEWSNLTAGRRTLFELAGEGLVPPVFAASDDPDRLVPIVTEASKFVIAVAGDPNRANAFVMSNDGPHGYWTTAEIDYAPASDLVCRID